MIIITNSQTKKIPNRNCCKRSTRME